MSTNRITTKSYFIKRLRDCGYVVDKLDIEYLDTDSRKWSVLLDNAVSSIIITCYDDNTFSFYDGQRFLNSNLKLSTDSIEVIVEHLNMKGIINKHPKYNDRQNSK